MARLVVLEFDDDGEADTLVEDWNRARQEAPRQEDGTLRIVLLTPQQENDVQCKIIGMYKRPTLFCDPSDGHRCRKTNSGWTKGKKWGWWVCGSCHKPSKLWGNNVSAIIGSARNLLLEESQPQPPIDHPIAAEVAQDILTNTGGGVV